VFPKDEALYRGEAVAAVVGEAESVEAIEVADFPIIWEQLPPLSDIDAALAAGARLIHRNRLRIFWCGTCVRGDVETALASAEVVAEASTKRDL